MSLRSKALSAATFIPAGSIWVETLKNNSAEYTKANREHSPCYKLAQNTTRK